VTGTNVVTVNETPDAQETERQKRIVKFALAEVFRSVHFRNSKQCQGLMKYLVEKSLRGEHDLLRERVIGAEVFGRAADYDAGNDPIVRLRVAEVRKRLARYYLDVESGRANVHIEIPSGHYRALFKFVAATEPDAQKFTEPNLSSPALESSDPSADPASVRTPETSPSPRAGLLQRRRWLWLAACLAGVAVSVVLLLRHPFPYRETAIDQFWSPAVKVSMPVIIHTGTNVVYRFSPAFLEKYRKTHHAENLDNRGPEFKVNMDSAGPISVHDLMADDGTYLSVGDMTAINSFTSMFTRREKNYELRYGSDLSPGDMRSAPTILICSFSNNWTLDVTNPLRFAFLGGITITDKFDKNRSWSVNVMPDGSTTDDYAIITRLLPTGARQAVITAAGIGQYGTQAASDFVTNPQRMAEFARSATANWYRQNLQIVIQVRVMNSAPESINVVASYFW